MSAEVSEAFITDAEEISALAIRTYVETFGHEFEPDDLAWHIDQTMSARIWRSYLLRDRVLWARIGERAVGFVQFGPSDDGAGEIAIHRLYVDADYQGQGIGSDLLRRALAEPEVAASPLVRIDVWEKNFGAQRLYARFGFVHEGGLEPFILQSGEIDGYDFILVRRRPA